MGNVSLKLGIDYGEAEQFFAEKLGLNLGLNNLQTEHSQFFS